ncbi:MAG: GWxTD domain-containing protein [Gemmatimonadota bacterium]|nr:GWxTD domain-containing protein [Gemmatimonadota bacterium]MDH4347413.1 GWxTD domain-containing protein [Gemmatimonadota bacterium]MDH5282516.1 GWxTD domain-containing protein [Gemmatimonadota bacterium]
MLDPGSTYRRLGRLVGSAELPFVGDIAFYRSGGDSAVALLSVSLQTRHFAFQKDGEFFVARYRAIWNATPAAGGPPRSSSQEQVVRVNSFAETQRSDESVLYQDGLVLSPGEWKVSLQIADELRGRKGGAQAQVRVPAFVDGSVSAPRLVYQARGRGARSEALGVVVNPRGSIPYGSDSLTLYLEGYAMPGPTTVPLVLVGPDGEVVGQDSIRFEGNRDVESLAIRLRADSLPLGELRVAVGRQPADSLRAVVSFSAGWVVTNYEDMVSLLRYYQPSPALDSLRKAPQEERSRRWQAFWRATDPNPGTSAHEGLEQYFTRVTVANLRFRDESVEGWRTDRGEVLIRLGEPDEIFDASPQSEGRVIRWNYIQLRLTIYFHDPTGFGRFDLTPSSRSELEQVIARLSRQTGF